MKDVRDKSRGPRIEVIPSCNRHLCLAKEFELLACCENSVKDFKCGMMLFVYSAGENGSKREKR